MPDVLSEQEVATDQPAGRKGSPVHGALAVISLVIGLVAFVAGVIALRHVAPAFHVVASIAGLVGFFLGMYSQLISTSTSQRWLNVLGIGAAFVGLGLGLGMGGF